MSIVVVLLVGAVVFGFVFHYLFLIANVDKLNKRVDELERKVNNAVKL